MQQGLKDVGANVRAGISGFGGGVVEGVRGGVSALIRNKFGSADNIAHLKDTLGAGNTEDTPPRTLSGSATLVSSPKYGSDDECSSGTSGSAAGSNSGGGGGAMCMGSPRLDGHHHHHHHHHTSSSWDALLEGWQEIKASQVQMEDAMEDMKSQLQSDYSYMSQCLQEERYRCVSR